MPRQRRQAQFLPVIVEGEVREWAVEIHVRPPRIAGVAPHHKDGPAFRINGVFTEPVKGQVNFSFVLTGRSEVSNTSGEIGRIHCINPVVSGMLELDHTSLQALISMAYAGQLKNFMIFLDPPFRGKASVRGCDFGAGARL